MEIRLKHVKTVLVLALAMGMLAGCSTGGNSPLSEFEERDGLLTYVDTENSPFDDSGLEITIKQGDEGYATFVITDLEANPTVDYYTFDYADHRVEKYYYVSAMGTGYYYYYDLETSELVRIEDMDHNDSTDSVKEVGRWDSAVESTKEEVAALETYFQEQHHINIKEAVLGE